jgi:NADH:ubiquinone oxidoreductase subunit 6 (subunit J)
MLNVKTEEQNIFSSKDADLQKTLTKFIILNIFLILSASSVYLFLGNVFLENELYIFQGLYNNIFNFDSLNNIDILGQVLYNYFLVCFLLAGLILLIALIGAIVLTLRFNTFQIKQHVFRQLSRTDNLFSFFK